MKASKQEVIEQQVFVILRSAAFQFKHRNTDQGIDYLGLKIKIACLELIKTCGGTHEERPTHLVSPLGALQVISASAFEIAEPLLDDRQRIELANDIYQTVDSLLEVEAKKAVPA